MSNDLPSLFLKLSHGVYVVGVASDDEKNAFTASWVMQVSFSPLLLALSINPSHSSYEMLKKSGVFSVNVLPSGRLDLAEHFGQSNRTDKLSDIAWHQGKTIAPILDDAIAFFECKYSHECEAGDHRLVIGRVMGGDVIQAQAKPMTYQETGTLDGSSVLFSKVLV
jgi:flavin reductase (DIM6/NTAB) family NADH-FMN oxidoreductase RutF